jgi:hypothetical protein
MLCNCGSDVDQRRELRLPAQRFPRNPSMNRETYPMSTRAYISGLLFLMIAAVLFGIGATAVLTIPDLNANAWIWLPFVAAFSFLISPFIAWVMAPSLRVRQQRRQASAGNYR